jgi:hypothetical protein
VFIKAGACLLCTSPTDKMLVPFMAAQPHLLCFDPKLLLHRPGCLVIVKYPKDHPHVTDASNCARGVCGIFLGCHATSTSRKSVTPTKFSMWRTWTTGLCLCVLCRSAVEMRPVHGHRTMAYSVCLLLQDLLADHHGHAHDVSARWQTSGSGGANNSSVCTAISSGGASSGGAGLGLCNYGGLIDPLFTDVEGVA